MKRMARFFYGNGALSRENPPNTQVNESAHNEFDPRSPWACRIVTIKETEWRAAPLEYQKRVQKGETVRVVDYRGSLVVELRFRSVSTDANAEREMQELLDKCRDNRIALNGSWLE
jgi:hypothetical protein